jgi:hypothetical protein
VEAHDGAMSVSSRPGEGTVVEVRLPLGRPAGSRSAGAAAAPDPSGTDAIRP